MWRCQRQRHCLLRNRDCQSAAPFPCRQVQPAEPAWTMSALQGRPRRALVYELYGLTDEEIKIVEEGTRR